MKKKKQNNIGEFDLNMDFDLNMEFDLNRELWEEQDLNQETNQETKQGEFTLELRGNSDKKQVDAVKAR